MDYNFGLKRRAFVQILGAGLLIAVSAPALAQRRGGRGGGGARSIAARIHLGKDGTITVMVGKVEAGQGARTELSQAAAEELRVPLSQIQLVMADTSLVPDDGITAGSGSTPRTVPAVRQGAAAARELLIDFACKRWNVDLNAVQLNDGKVTDTAGQRTLTYADLAADEDAAKAFQQPIPSDLTLTSVKEWKVLGNPARRPNGTRHSNRRAQVSVGHHPARHALRQSPPRPRLRREAHLGGSRPGQSDEGCRGRAGRPICWSRRADRLPRRAGASGHRQDGQVGAAPHPASKDLFDYLKQHAQDYPPASPFADELAKAKHVLRQSYHVAYVQHAPLEPRAAVAEWTDGKLTVWAGTQNPFGYRSDLMRAFHLSDDHVRVVVPDFGGGFGGKHTGEAAEEAARLAQAAGKPVSLRWTREEEFTWAYSVPRLSSRPKPALTTKGR